MINCDLELKEKSKRIIGKYIREHLSIPYVKAVIKVLKSHEWYKKE